MRGASVRRDSLSARSRRQTARVCLLLAGVAAAAGLLGYVLGTDGAPLRNHTTATQDSTASAKPERFMRSWFGGSQVLTAGAASQGSQWHRQGVPKWSWGMGEASAEEQPKVVSRHNTVEQEAAPDRMIVVARGKEDVSYLSIFLPDIPHTVYQGGWRPENALLDRGIEPAFKAAPQAKETNVYLQYIVDHYDRLPRSIAFIHAHRVSWHLGDVVDVLRELRWGEVDFGNLRYRNYSQWSCGPGALFPCDWSGSVLTPHNPTDPKYAHQPDFGSVQQIAAMVARHWPAFFEKELGPLPEYIYAPCCAEFLVSADRIRKRPLAFYQRALDLANNMDAGSDHVDVALAFEYAWHMIFGEPAVSWPLDRCQLLHCKEGAGQQAQQDSASAQPRTGSVTAAQQDSASAQPQAGSATAAQQDGAAAQPRTGSAIAAQQSEDPRSDTSATAMQGSTAGSAGTRDGASVPNSDAAAGPSRANGTAGSSIDDLTTAASPSSKGNSSAEAGDAAVPGATNGNSTAKSGGAVGPGGSNGNSTAAAGEARLQDVTKGQTLRVDSQQDNTLSEAAGATAHWAR